MIKDFIFGVHPVMEALRSGKVIDKILIDRSAKGDYVQALSKQAKERSIPIVRVPDHKLNKITTANHQGIIAYMAQVNYANFEDVLQSVYEKGDTPLLLILDRITDVRNFGAIARSAECLGVQCLIIPEKGAAQINAIAVKTSAGALNYLPISRVKSLRKALKTLSESGLQIVACTERANTELYCVDMRTPTALILGSEEDGISAELLEYAHFKIKIPMLGAIQSLNVSVATGVILYEAVRQRLSGGDTFSVLNRG